MPSSRKPPAVDLARAVAHLEAREWQAAHEIVQQDESDLAGWLHGIVHTLEGDLDNARYWYRRVRRAFPGPEAVDAEIARARQAVDDTPERSKERS
jgi:hypothetical protein